MKPAPRQIPHSSVRLSVMFGDYLLTADVEVDKVGQSLRELEEYAASRVDLAKLAGTVRGFEGAASLATWAASVKDEPGMIQVVCVAALWMALNHPTAAVAYEVREAMKRRIKEDGGCWFTAATDENGLDWGFSVEPVALAEHGGAAMPWPRRHDDETVH